MNKKVQIYIITTSHYTKTTVKHKLSQNTNNLRT